MEHFYKHVGKIKTSYEGLMVGNGGIGGLLYGEEKLTLSLDLVSLWDKRVPEEFRDKNFNYPYMVQCMEKDYKRLYELFDNCYLHPYPTKINAARVLFDEEIEEDSLFELSFERGTFSFKNSKNCISGYVDAYKNVLVLESKKRLSFSFEMSKYLTESVSNGGLGYAHFKEKKEGSYRVVHQKMYGGHSYIVLSKEVPLKDGTFLYLFTIAKDVPLFLLKETLNRYARKKGEYRAEHLAYYRDYFSKGIINTPDPALDDLYIKGLYFFACNSRKRYPMTLQGVWTQNNDFLPPWKSDLHNDINVEMTYDSYCKTGHREEGEVLVDYLYSKRKNFQRFAKRFMKSEGLLVPGVMTQEGLPLGGWPQYALSPAVSIWVLKAFDDYYAYYPDKRFLKNRAFPFFEGTERCIRKYLRKNKDGKLELDFHSSPEFYENDPKSLFNNQTNFELTMLRYLYSTLVRYCALLGKDSSYYGRQLSSLADYYRDPEGLLKISMDEDFCASHRHFSHMLMYKNLRLVDPFENQKEIRRDIDHLLSFSTKEWVGFSFTEASGLLSYVFDGEGAYKYLKIFSEAFVHPNGFHMNCDYKHLGYSDLNCYVMTLEANVGFVSALADMMILDCFGTVRLFPAIPSFFKEKGVSFSKLHIQNDVFVSAAIKGNAVRSFSFESKRPFSLSLYNDIGTDFVLSVDGKKVALSMPLGEKIHLKAMRSITYTKEEA